MNFLNNDFDTSGEAKLTGAQDMRDYYISTTRRPSSSFQLGHPAPKDLYFDHSYREGNAGPLGTFFWNTVVLGERSARNYSRNLLAYGVRAGMYAGEYLAHFHWRNIF